MQAQQALAKFGNWTTPEICLKTAQELYNTDKNWKEALAVLHIGITNRKTKQNTLILEKLMTCMIDICTENHTTLYLKEDIGLFRNLCQNQSMNLLTSVIGNLRKKCEAVFTDIEKEFTHEQLMKYLSDHSSIETHEMNEMDTAGDELILLAYTGIDSLNEKNRILPRVNYFLEISKIILDTLRSNSKLLDFYNETTRLIFNYCRKYKSSKEYKVIAETLHSHFNQIIKSDKNPEGNSKIPFPIKLEEAD